MSLRHRQRTFLAMMMRASSMQTARRGEFLRASSMAAALLTTVALLAVPFGAYSPVMFGNTMSM